VTGRRAVSSNGPRPELTAAWNLAVEAELAFVLGAFARERLDVVVLKGTPLLRRLGEPLVERTLADNDLLVRGSSLIAAERVLERLGYQSTRPLSLSVRAGSGQHSMVRQTPVVRHVVDLHWAAFHAPFRGVSPELVWAHTEVSSVGGQEVRVLDRPLTLLHTAAHFVWHSMGQLRLLRTLGRAWDAWGHELDPAELRHLALRTGTLPSLEYSLRAAQELGLARGALRFTTLRARTVRELLPPAELLLKRPVPDYERMAVALILVSTERALIHALRLALPSIPEAEILAGASGPQAVARTYLLRPFYAARRLRAYRRHLAREVDDA